VSLVRVLIVMILLAGSACDFGGTRRAAPGGTPRPEPTGSDTRVVGLVATMSGPESWRGEDAFEGADLGVHVLNRGLGEDEAPFELVTLDDTGDAARAATLISQLAAFEQTVGIVYAGPPDGLARAEGVLDAAGIPGILCFGDLYSARRLRPHIFQTSPPLLWQARRLASYLIEDRGYEKVGLLASRTDSGDVAVSSLRAAVSEEGGRRVAVAHYGEGPQRAQLRSLRARRVEAVVLEGPPSALPALERALVAAGARYRTTSAARIASAPPAVRARRTGSPYWHPQVAGFDLAVAPGGRPRIGTVAAEAYSRGAHFLPVKSLRSFDRAFVDWWDAEPTGWELRAYEAAGLIGWAARRAEQGRDLARVLERVGRRRFGGLDVTLGPDDHTAVEQTTVGLWVVPRAAAAPPRRGNRLPWVPLARGFAIDGDRTDILARDWRYLFRNPPPPRAPAPRFTRMRFAVTTRRSDPVH
jgi:ABC-type branched-subunit amino acid transport system substrate-binding protein